MPAHNPYVAWMYEKYGQLDPVSKTIIDCFEQMRNALNSQAYVLSLVIRDKLERRARERAILTQPIASLAEVDGALVSGEVLLQLIRSARRPFEQAVKDSDKAAFLAEALEYHMLGRIVDAERMTERQLAAASGSTDSTGHDAIGRALSMAAGFSSVADSDERFLRALGAQIEEVASDVVRQVLYGEMMPIRLTENFLCAPAPGPSPASEPGEPQPGIARDPNEREEIETATSESAATTQHIVCEYCGARLESGEETCDKCRNTDDSSIKMPRLPIYASMGQRFCAYLADYIVIYFIVLLAYVVSTLIGTPLSSDDSAANMVALLALFVYMAVAQMSCHTTVGKYIMGIEVVNELPDRQYPTWGRILLRESFGRLCSLILWGAGYWTAIRHPSKQAWSDRMSGTLVIARRTNPLITRALMVFLLIALLVDVGVTGWGYQVQEQEKRYKAVSSQLTSLGSTIETSRKEVERLMSADAADLEGYRRNMRQLTPWLDRYDSQVDQMQIAIRTALIEGTIPSSSEKQQMEKILRLWDVRKQQSQRRRDQAQVILNYVPSPLSVKQFQSELEMIESDINSLEQHANQLLSEIQKK